MPSAATKRKTTLPLAVCWRAFEARDWRYDSAFVVAVHSTGIYCRPSCPARHPKRQNVEFLADADAAEGEGFRACRRCRPREAGRAARVASMTRYIEQHAAQHDNEPLRLAALAKVAGLSAHHAQRIFRRAMGITPRQFADALRLRRLKEHLRKGDDVTTSLYEAGYGSSSRLYERSYSQLGMTPATYRRGGIGMTIAYTIVASPLGRMLIAGTRRGISAVYLGESDADLEAALRQEYPHAEIYRDAKDLNRWVTAVLRHLDCGAAAPTLGSGGLGETSDRGEASPENKLESARKDALLDFSTELPLDVQATAFQQRVWKALRAIPYGTTKTYSQIAKSLGQPRAVRAVARACATNPVSLVVPCHRVVREDGNLAGYRWGLERKRTLLERERAAASKPAGKAATSAANPEFSLRIRTNG